MPGLTQSVKEDLYRFGNALSPRLDYVREETDVQTGHFALCPAFDMNREDYRSLWLGLEAHSERIRKLIMIDLNRWESRVILEALRA
jgi:hypothetical protein